MTVEDYLAVPYVVAVESIELPNGVWIRRASNPELAGVVVEAASTVEAVEKLDELRVRYIVETVERGGSVPRPRPPLRG